MFCYLYILFKMFFGWKTGSWDFGIGDLINLITSCYIRILRKILVYIFFMVYIHTSFNIVTYSCIVSVPSSLLLLCSCCMVNIDFHHSCFYKYRLDKSHSKLPPCCEILLHTFLQVKSNMDTSEVNPHYILTYSGILHGLWYCS